MAGLVEKKRLYRCFRGWDFPVPVSLLRSMPSPKENRSDRTVDIPRKPSPPVAMTSIEPRGDLSHHSEPQICAWSCLIPRRTIRVRRLIAQMRNQPAYPGICQSSSQIPLPFFLQIKWRGPGCPLWQWSRTNVRFSISLTDAGKSVPQVPQVPSIPPVSVRHRVTLNRSGGFRPVPTASC